jgi:CheY-like chemotaxis protein
MGVKIAVPVPQTPSPLVLLVEDDRDSREMYALALAMAGFETAEASTVVEARAAAVELRPDVLVTDLTLPDGDGRQLCSELLADERTRSTIVIALTGHSGHDEMAAATAAGCTKVLVKPCPPDTLASEIASAIAGRAR